MNEAHVIREARDVRQQVADHLPRLTARPERPERLDQIAVLTLERDQLVGPGHRRVVPFDQLGLVIKRVDVTDCSGAKNEQHAIRPRREVR